MNSFAGVGRMVRDADIRYTSDNKAIARFSLAITRDFDREKYIRHLVKHLCREDRTDFPEEIPQVFWAYNR